MSKTTPVDVVSVSYWRNMAVQVREALLEFATTPEFEFPLGVLKEAMVFLESAREEARHRIGGRIPSNPEASLVNYNYAARAIEVSGFSVTQGLPPRANLTILALTDFIGCLCNEGGPFSDEEKDMARRVARFFDGLAALSE